jgi:hypothetical protein
MVQDTEKKKQACRRQGSRGARHAQQTIREVRAKH